VERRAFRPPGSCERRAVARHILARARRAEATPLHRRRASVRRANVDRGPDGPPVRHHSLRAADPVVASAKRHPFWACVLDRRVIAPGSAMRSVRWAVWAECPSFSVHHAADLPAPRDRRSRVLAVRHTAKRWLDRELSYSPALSRSPSSAFPAPGRTGNLAFISFIGRGRLRQPGSWRKAPWPCRVRMERADLHPQPCQLVPSLEPLIGNEGYPNDLLVYAALQTVLAALLLAGGRRHHRGRGGVQVGAPLDQRRLSLLDPRFSTLRRHCCHDCESCESGHRRDRLRAEARRYSRRW
jgi:hypothetical protein